MSFIVACITACGYRSISLVELDFSNDRRMIFY